MNINEPTPPQETAPVWRLAFRAGFLLAGAFAVLGMARWLYWMQSPASWDYNLDPSWWHAHEMVFGFAMPVVAGFLLTAVATWTGIPGTSGRRLQLLFGLWLLARILLWLAPGQLALAWLAEMLFIGFIIFELTHRVWARRQWRNLLFTPVLLALAVLNAASYWCADDPVATTRLHYGAVWMVTVLVVIIGGRVIPLFTGNRLGFKITPQPLWLDVLAIGSTALIGLVSAILPWDNTGAWLQALCLAGCAIHLFRLAWWQGWRTGKEPLLWSMHLSYLCIPLAMLGLALEGSDPVASKNVIHLLAVGAVGGMILAMMSRVALGHTGRPLQVPAYLAGAFGMLFLAAIIRTFLPLVAFSLTPLAWRISALLWIAAFGLFVFRYLPVLTRPRADDKPG